MDKKQVRVSGESSWLRTLDDRFGSQGLLPQAVEDGIRAQRPDLFTEIDRIRGEGPGPLALEDRVHEDAADADTEDPGVGSEATRGRRADDRVSEEGTRMGKKDASVSREATFSLTLYYRVDSEGIRYVLPQDSIDGQSVELESKDGRISGYARFLHASQHSIDLEVRLGGPEGDSIGGIAPGPFTLQYRIGEEATDAGSEDPGVGGERARLLTLDDARRREGL